MAARRLQKGDGYTKKLVLFAPEMCAFIQERADATHLSFNAALDQYLRASIPPATLKALERKVRQPQVAAAS